MAMENIWMPWRCNPKKVFHYEKIATENFNRELDLNAVEIAEHQSAHLHVNVLLSNSQKVARESKKSS